jgi:hypothetical protein
MFSVTIANMTDGTVQCHKAGCRDLTQVRRTNVVGGYLRVESMFTIEVETQRDAFLYYNADFLAEGQHEDDVYSLDWAPCTNHVPVDVRTEEPASPAPTGLTVKRGSKWTYLYAADGSVIAELRNDSLAAIAAFSGFQA